MIFLFNSLKYKKIHQVISQFIKNIIRYIKNIMLLQQQETVMPLLNEEITKAYKEWVDAKKVFEEINDELVDYAVFRLNAAERRYMYLLNEAKKSGMNAWEGKHANHNGEQSY